MIIRNQVPIMPNVYSHFYRDEIKDLRQNSKGGGGGGGGGGGQFIEGHCACFNGAVHRAWKRHRKIRHAVIANFLWLFFLFTKID